MGNDKVNYSFFDTNLDDPELKDESLSYTTAAFSIETHEQSFFKTSIVYHVV